MAKHIRRSVRRTQSAGPYAQTARRYLEAGWSPLYLPPGKKYPPPDERTGRGKPMATGDDVERWIREHGDGNICLRLPPGVIGIDVDTYKGPAERESWAGLVGRCGPLPAAPHSTSRADPDSGVRLYRAPEGVTFAGKLPAGASGVSPGEVIQHHHRYAVVWPSVHPDTSREYRWNLPAGDIPIAAELPSLNEPWVSEITAASRKPSQATRREPSVTHEPDTDWPGVYRYMSKPRLKGILRDWLTSLETAGPGDRMSGLFTTGLHLGSVIRAGQVTEEWAVDRLCEACESNGFFGKYPFSEFCRCVTSAFRYAGLEEQ